MRRTSVSLSRSEREVEKKNSVVRNGNNKDEIIEKNKLNLSGIWKKKLNRPGIKKKEIFINEK